ncbi:hypothetical protein L1987_14064 [Smallanthus sonchifolius]|uniref:Uncharacterized protein n=1 Tax=Smallanthus sonchifolius TaxID=185202 RepID=A0ACB9J283_9ASTR|nr:hypothetical protein L1987_14064 [Smallanthus sonchifolius]
MGGMGRGLGLRMHGITMHGDTLLFLIGCNNVCGQIRVPDSTVGGRDNLLRTSGSIRASTRSPISTGQRVIRRPKSANRYSPHLSELRVNEFVQETSELIDRRKGGGTHLKSGKNLCDGGGLGFAPNDGRDLHLGEVDSEVADPLPSPGNTPNLVNLPSHSEANEIGHSISLMTGDTPVIDTKMEGLSQPSSPVDSEMEGPKFASVTANYGSYSTLRDTSDVQTLPVSQSGPSVPNAVNKAKDLGVDSDGFNVVNRRKKRNGIKVQNKKQKPVVIKPSLQQNKDSRKFSMSGTNASGMNLATHSAYVRKEVTNLVNGQAQNGTQNSGGQKSKGFDFSRAVNGYAGGSKPARTVQVPPIQPGKSPPVSWLAGPVPGVIGSGNSPLAHPSSSAIGVARPGPCADTLVADKPAPTPNLQPNPLPVLAPVDTRNRFLVLDFQKSLKYNKLVGDSLESCMTDQFGSSDKEPDKRIEPPQEHIDCQILTADTPVKEGTDNKDYGISNAQKMAITSRLCGPAQAVRAVDMDNWEQGEHEFFKDQVKALGLDYDYCIEDVDSDDENGTAQFFAAQMKVGMPKVPIPTPTQVSK